MLRVYSRQDFRSIPSDLRLEIMKYVKREPDYKPKPLTTVYNSSKGSPLWKLWRCVYCNGPYAWSKVNRDGNFYNYTIKIDCGCF